MIGQILPNNNERCYSNFSPAFCEMNTPTYVHKNPSREVSYSGTAETPNSGSIRGAAQPTRAPGNYHHHHRQTPSRHARPTVSYRAPSRRPHHPRGVQPRPHPRSPLRDLIVRPGEAAAPPDLASASPPRPDQRPPSEDAGRRLRIP
jgi:hypothetical protein